jgi:hypothetical protein
LRTRTCSHHKSSVTTSTYPAWLYEGSESLWAGLIKELYVATENRFGADYAHAQEKAKVYSMVLQFVFALVMFVFGIISSAIYYTSDEYRGAVDVLLTIIPLAVSAAAGVNMGRTYLFSTVKDSTKLVKQVASASFRNQLGFMQDIKDGLQLIGQRLTSPKDLPNVWTYLLPNFLGPFRQNVESMCINAFGGQVKLGIKEHKQCKYVIFIDDLDRCSPEKAFEVLSSLVLLTETTPFVVFLAIDPRVVVTAIESVNSNFFSEAGINGYESTYLILLLSFSYSNYLFFLLNLLFSPNKIRVPGQDCQYPLLHTTTGHGGESGIVSRVLKW